MAGLFAVVQRIYKPITVVMLFALIIIVIKRTGNKEEQEDTTFKSGNKAGQAVTVTADTCFMGELVMRVTASGLVQAARQADIIPQSSGTVVALPAGEGCCVKKGDVLLQLDDREARLEWASARDALSKAEDSFVEQLMNAGSKVNADSETTPDYVTRMNQALEAARANGGHDTEAAALWAESAKNFASERLEARWASRSGLTAAKIALDRAELRLNQCSIKAPFSGVLGNQDVCIGRRVGTGKAVFALVDLSTVTIAAQCLESEVAHITPGSRATVSLAAFPDQTFAGRVTAVNPLVDEKTRTCRVTVELNNPGQAIKAGMYAEVSLEAARYQNRMLVPRNAVLERDSRYLVFIAREGLAQWCYVDLGLANDTYYEVTGSAFDLKAGELVLTEGHYTLAHDSPIKIKK